MHLRALHCDASSGSSLYSTTQQSNRAHCRPLRRQTAFIRDGDSPQDRVNVRFKARKGTHSRRLGIDASTMGICLMLWLDIVHHTWLIAYTHETRQLEPPSHHATGIERVLPDSSPDPKDRDAQRLPRAKPGGRADVPSSRLVHLGLVFLSQRRRVSSQLYAKQGASGAWGRGGQVRD